MTIINTWKPAVISRATDCGCYPCDSCDYSRICKLSEVRK